MSSAINNPSLDDPSPTVPRDGAGESLRILVVEDDEMIGELISDMLAEMGHSVCAVVGSESEAVRAAAYHRPELMIVDMRLADGSGIAAMAAVLRAGFVAHLFMSGNVSRVAALVPDAVALQKPFREAELARGIEQARAHAKRHAAAVASFAADNPEQEFPAAGCAGADEAVWDMTPSIAHIGRHGRR